MLKNKKDIPIPSLRRLLNVYRLLEQYEKTNVRTVSSSELGKRLNVKADSIRKDISYIGEVGNFGAGYEVVKLKAHISTKLDLDIKRRLCVVGLGRLGTAVLNYNDLSQNGFFVVAGFDSNINKLETIKTTVELHPAHEIPEVVQRKAIDIGVITVLADAAQEVADRLMDGGIKGIINFSLTAICGRENVRIRNIDLLGECMILSVLMSMHDQTNGKTAFKENHTT
jgi:redox-sensing transcriptional repressor